MSLFRSVPLLLALLVLAGCAGLPGSGVASRVHLAASAAPVDPRAARDLISDYRASHGFARVEIDPTLERVAQDQALAMASVDTLSHTVAGSLATRLAGAGVPDIAAVENVSAGYDSLTAAVSGWRRSPPHNANLLDPKMRRVGIASATAPGSRYRFYWALVMTD